jgi:hypothetical protein
MPKRWGHLLDEVATIDNIKEADTKAQRGKSNIGIDKHKQNRDEDNQLLLESLLSLNYETSAYSTFTIHEPKERLIFRLPFYPDRITHHAIMNIMEDKWVSTMIGNTYACIKNRGIHKLAKDLKVALKKDPKGTKYCLKLDIRKYYPSINHSILKQVLRRKIKDNRFLVILDEIIDSSEGVPIGNYLSQFFANLYLTYFDHWLKEVLKVKYYYRYCDDIAIFADTKEQLWDWFHKIKGYMEGSLRLHLKSNWQVYPVDSRGVDFVGYRFYHSHTLLRTSIKKRINKLVEKYMDGKLSKDKFMRSMSSYYGWLKHCDSHNFLYHLECKTGVKFSAWNGELSIISSFYGRSVFLVEMEEHKKYIALHFVFHGKPYTVRSISKKLKKNIKGLPRLPITFKIKKYGKSKKNPGGH